MELENTEQSPSKMKKVVKSPMFISTVSTVVALGVGVAATVYGTRRIRQNKLVETPVSSVTLEKWSNKLDRLVEDLYLDDSDLGYC